MAKCKTHGEELNKDCPECMELWNKFLEKNNLYVVTDKE